MRVIDDPSSLAKHFTNQPMKTIYVSVKVQIADDADAHDVIANCDYSFTDDDGQIIDTEIVGVTDEFDRSVFG